jgi:murein DD-endopeptidase MepM/ murein hydrolase activator NlpD
MRQFFLFFLIGTLLSCYGLQNPEEQVNLKESSRSLAPVSDTLAKEALVEEEDEDEEPISLPPGMGPESQKSRKYTHLTPGSLRVFDWPVDEARLSRGYFLKDPRGRKRRPHLGIDLANKKGTPIFASHDGKVIYVGTGFRGYGRMIMIEGESGDYATLYAHLFKARVKQGMWVRQGDFIGTMGNTGRSTGTHLHFEIRTLQGAVDPIAYLPQVSDERPSNIFGKAFTKPRDEEHPAGAL